ncbi:MAG: serine/threonine protein kinase, partial [Eubacterium sp.]|nr:serine/threonine protein kinase [Eubacterium sp.]
MNDKNQEKLNSYLNENPDEDQRNVPDNTCHQNQLNVPDNTCDQNQVNVPYDTFDQNQEDTHSEAFDHVSLPESWSDWHLTGILGEGAYGRVYRAEDRDGHISAIKIFRLPQDAKVPETDLLPLMKDLPGIVRVEDYYIKEAKGKSEGLLRMEYLTDLTGWRRKHPLSEEEAISMMTDLCDALIVCEKQGIIHRDIKPGNILITEGGHAKLGDFGVARIAGPSDPNLSLAGTFRYMAPEIYHGESYDHRADLYSLGMVFYEQMNRGKIPFEEKGREGGLKLRMDGTHFPEPVEASKGFAEILCKACAFKPEARYQNAQELKEDLISLQEGTYQPKKKPTKKSRKKKLLIATAMILLFIVATTIAFRI